MRSALPDSPRNLGTLMRLSSLLRRPARPGAVLATLVILLVPIHRVSGQASPPPDALDTLSLVRAQALAREASAELRAARASVAVAEARLRQGAAFANPTLSVRHEQSGANGLSNSQLIAAIDQPIEIAGTRGARQRVLALRLGAAEATRADAERGLDFEVAEAFAAWVAAERSLALSQEAAEAFAEAAEASDARFAAGDISGYAHRRLRLESARYAGFAAERALAQRSARRSLARLLGVSDDALPRGAAGAREAESAETRASDDSLRRIATRERPDLRAARLAADAARAETVLARRERFPFVSLSAGVKNEQVGGVGALRGLVAGVALPLPLWDRNSAAIDASLAVTTERTAEAEALERRIATEVGDAADAHRTIQVQLDLLRPRLGGESTQALRAARVAYAEGEITLLEWLDAVRAYHDAELTFASLEAQATIRRAALERAIGLPITRIVP